MAESMKNKNKVGMDELFIKVLKKSEGQRFRSVKLLQKFKTQRAQRTQREKKEEGLKSY